MKRVHQTTIKDIANALNISVATVSRALRDTFDVNNETRDKVLKKANELKYRINYNARSLKSQFTNNIGVLMPTISNYYFSTVFNGIQEVAEKNNLNVILYVTNESLEKEISIVESLSLSSIDGLLICVTRNSYDCSHIKNIMDAGVPVVFFDRIAENINTSKVTQNDYEGAYLATEYLIKQGYERIAHITGALNLSLTQGRIKGYLKALRRYKKKINYDYLIGSDFTQASGENDVRELWQLKNPPNAIFAVNDRKAIGAMLELQERKVKIGIDVGVIGFTNDPISTIISPNLTTIEEPAFDVGKKSCSLLLQHIKKNNFISENIVLNCKLIERESTKRKPKP